MPRKPGSPIAGTRPRFFPRVKQATASPEKGRCPRLRGSSVRFAVRCGDVHRARSGESLYIHRQKTDTVHTYATLLPYPTTIPAILNSSSSCTGMGAYFLFREISAMPFSSLRSFLQYLPSNLRSTLSSRESTVLIVLRRCVMLFLSTADRGRPKPKEVFMVAGHLQEKKWYLLCGINLQNL